MPPIIAIIASGYPNNCKTNDMYDIYQYHVLPVELKNNPTTIRIIPTANIEIMIIKLLLEPIFSSP
jgi:hypothetical protein